MFPYCKDVVGVLSREALSMNKVNPKTIHAEFRNWAEKSAASATPVQDVSR